MADPKSLNLFPLEGSNPSTPTIFLSYADYGNLMCKSVPQLVGPQPYDMWPAEAFEIWETLALFVGESFW